MLFERGNPPRKAIVRVVVVIVIAIYVGAQIGDLLFGAIIDERPELLIALNPHNRNLVLATNQLDAWTYYIVGMARMSISGPLYFLLGYWYGDKAMAWTEKRSKTFGPMLRDGQGPLRKMSYPLVFAFPNNLLCGLSAIAGARLRTFMICYMSGAVVRLYLIRRLGEVFESPIRGLVDRIAEYQTPVLIISAVLVAWTVFREFRGGTSPFKAFSRLGDEDDAGPTDSGSTDS